MVQNSVYFSPPGKESLDPDACAVFYLSVLFGPCIVKDGLSCSIQRKTGASKRRFKFGRVVEMASTSVKSVRLPARLALNSAVV
jgi:hypothetical protein